MLYFIKRRIKLMFWEIKWNLRFRRLKKTWTQPMGVHYPILVQEIKELESLGQTISPNKTEELLDWLWDVYLEEGKEDAHHLVKMQLRFLEIRIKLLSSNRIDPDEAKQELSRLVDLFTRKEMLDVVTEIKNYITAKFSETTKSSVEN